MDKDGSRLFEKINGMLNGSYIPIDDAEYNMLIRNVINMENGLLKNNLKHDIIVYRNDSSTFGLEGVLNKFLSTSVTQKGVLGENPNVAIIVPKFSNGAYVEKIADDRFKKQREFILNTQSKLRMILKTSDRAIYVLE